MTKENTKVTNTGSVKDAGGMAAEVGNFRSQLENNGGTLKPAPAPKPAPPKK